MPAPAAANSFSTPVNSTPVPRRIWPARTLGPVRSPRYALSTLRVIHHWLWRSTTPPIAAPSAPWARRPAYHLFRTGRARAEPRAEAHLPTFRQAIPAMTRFQARCRGLWSCRSGRTGEVQHSKGRDRPARCSGTFSGSYGPSLHAPPLPRCGITSRRAGEISETAVEPAPSIHAPG